MRSASITIERVLVKDLYEYACTTISQASHDDEIPISEHRALAQSKNPYADPDDIALLVARCGRKIVGYQGLLPGRLLTPDGFAKVYWGTAGYVMPEYRKHLVAIKLVQEILSRPYDLGNTGISRVSEKFCRGMRYLPAGPLAYQRWDLASLARYNPATVPFRAARRLQAVIRPEKSGLIRSMIRFIDRLILPAQSRLFYRLALFRRARRLSAHLRWEQVTKLGQAEARLIDNKNTGAHFYRGVDYINWMLDNRWAVGAHEAKNAIGQFYFSHVRDDFRFIPLRAYIRDEYAGFIVFSLSVDNRRTHLKVLDYGCADPANYATLAGLVVRTAADRAADVVDMPLRLGDHLKGWFPARLVCAAKSRIYYFRPYAPDSPLGRYLSDITLSYCDGDCAFT